MKAIRFKQALQQLAEEAIPAEVDPWPAVQVRMRMRVANVHQGEFRMHPTQTINPRRRLVWLAAGAMLLIAVALVTPMGQAWARQIWQFFIHQPGDSFPVPTPLDPNNGLATGELRPTATQISLSGCGDWGKPLCTLAQVQERVDFPLQQFKALPEGTTFQGAYNQDGVVLLRYSQGLDLSQGRSEDFPDLFTEVGASAQVEAVQVGSAQGEYVQGAWFVDPQQGQRTWRSGEGLQTLRWQADDIVFTIAAYEPRWTRADLESLANSLTTKGEQNEKDLSHLTSLTEAEAIVGYPLRAFDPIPPGYIFHYASVEPASRSVCLHYLYTRNDGPGPYLRIGQGPTELAPELDLISEDQDLESVVQQPVEVGGAQDGLWIRGLKRTGWACAETDDGYAGEPSLTFNVQGQRVDLYVLLTGCVMPEGFTRLGALRLAESLTGTTTHAEDELDPECLEGVDEATQLAGFPVKAPGWLPPGLVFARASFYQGEAGPSVSLLIQDAASGQTVFSITQAPLQPGDSRLAETYDGIPAGGYERLEIHDAPAVVVRGSWVVNENGEKEWYQSEFFAETLYWERDGLLITIAGPWFADDGGDSLATLVAIAKGLQ